MPLSDPAAGQSGSFAAAALAAVKATRTTRNTLSGACVLILGLRIAAPFCTSSIGDAFRKVTLFLACTGGGVFGRHDGAELSCPVATRRQVFVVAPKAMQLKRATRAMNALSAPGHVSVAWISCILISNSRMS